MRKYFFLLLVFFVSACSESISPLSSQSTANSSVEVDVTKTTNIPSTPQSLIGDIPTASLVDLTAPTFELILDPDQAIDYSHDLLIHKGLEHDKWSYDSAHYAQVRFPDGTNGVFITIGFSGIARGYQFLYKVGGERAELIEPIRAGRYDWGIKNLSTFEKADLEYIELFPGTGRQSAGLIKVVGAGHAGTGLWDDGYFEIIEITNEGIRVVFSGVETFRSNHQANQFEYQYIDLNEDGLKEIIKTGKQCEYEWNPAESDSWKEIGCEEVREEYEYDGIEYVKIF